MYIPKKRFWLVMASVSLILISSIVSGMSFSRYEVMQNLTGSNSKLGSLVFDVTNIPNNNQNIVLPLTEVIPGMSAQTYKFSITNYSGSTYSHLPFAYDIKIQTYGNLPITVQVKNNSISTNSGVAAATISGTSSINAPLNITTSGQMYINTSSTTQNYVHEYSVIITWPTTNAKEEKYSTEVEYLSISVVASQLAPSY